MWIERHIKTKLQKASESRPVVLLTGARQTGKSSLLQREFTEAEYITFDNIQTAEAASDSPSFFLNRLSDNKTVILDEIQYVPQIFRELKIIVDKNRKQYGRWVLTGSQQFELMEKISETLTGRISIMHLETLSALELRNSGINTINEFIFKGGYPELWSNPFIDSGDFFESYIRTYIERDLRNIIEVRNLHLFQRFIRLIAARVGQLLNYSSIASDAGVSDVTIRKWIHAMQISGIIYLLPPFHANIGKRLTKSPKIYFADHGLLSYLLNISSIDEWAAHISRGNIWENIVLMEILKTHGLRPGEKLFFYRDQNGVEIDFLVENGKELYLIEAKSNERPDKKKLNFEKVSEVLQNKYKTHSFLMYNAPDNLIAKNKNYYSLNPLLTDFNIFETVK